MDQRGCEFRLSPPIFFGLTCKSGAVSSHSLDEIPLPLSSNAHVKQEGAFCIECATTCE